MTSSVQPILYSSHRLSIEEFQDGVNLALFGRQTWTAWITPLCSVAILGWGIYLGWQGIGKVYIMLGASFLLLQIIMRLWLIPYFFKRQFQKNQARFTEMQQGIALYQDEFVVSAGEREQAFSYQGVASFRIGKLCYAIELKSKTMILVSKSAIAETGKQEIFERAFSKR